MTRKATALAALALCACTSSSRGAFETDAAGAQDARQPDVGSADGGCSFGCASGSAATIDVSCAGFAVVSATLSGAACAASQSALACLTATSPCEHVSFFGSDTGACVVTLRFADGFQYVGSIDFEGGEQTCGCPPKTVPLLSPSPATLRVSDGDSATCVDASTSD